MDTLLPTQSFDRPWGAGIRDRLRALLRPVGFTRAQSVDAIRVLVDYVLGTALVAAGRGSGASARAFGTGLDLLVDGLRDRVSGDGDP